MAVTDDLAVIRGAVTELAFARVTATGLPAGGFIPMLDSIDAMISRWSGDSKSPDDHYRLGLLMGTLAYMVACRVDTEGELEPLPVEYPADNPVASAARNVRDAVLALDAPAAAR